MQYFSQQRLISDYKVARFLAEANLDPGWKLVSSFKSSQEHFRPGEQSKRSEPFDCNRSPDRVDSVLSSIDSFSDLKRSNKGFLSASSGLIRNLGSGLSKSFNKSTPEVNRWPTLRRDIGSMGSHVKVNFAAKVVLKHRGMIMHREGVPAR